MNQARQHLFTAARLAADQHRRIGRRHAPRQFADLARFRVLGEHGRGRGGGRLHARHPIQQDFGREGFEQVVGGPVAHGIDRLGHRAVRGNQHKRHLRAPRAHLAQQVVAVHAIHLHIADNHIDGVALHAIQGFAAVRGGQRAITAELDRVAERLAQRVVVLYHQHTGRCVHCSLLFLVGVLVGCLSGRRRRFKPRSTGRGGLGKGQIE